MNGSQERPTRRSILKLAAGASAAAIAGLVGRAAPARAASGDAVVLGQANTAAAQTDIQSSNGVGYTLKVTSTASGAIGGFSTDSIGVSGVSVSGGAAGVTGQSTDGYGVDALSEHGWGARATSNSSLGLYARTADNTPSGFDPGSYRSAVVGVAGDATYQSQNTDEVGIYGFCEISSNSTGVWGDSVSGIGVAGSGDWGLLGVGRVGVYALANNFTDGYALYTKGRISFNGRSGRTSITSGHSYRDVTIAGMTTSSAVIATLQTHATGYYVQSVVSYAGKFRLYLNKTATSTIVFSYLVIN